MARNNQSNIYFYCRYLYSDVWTFFFLSAQLCSFILWLNENTFWLENLWEAQMCSSLSRPESLLFPQLVSHLQMLLQVISTFMVLCLVSRVRLLMCSTPIDLWPQSALNIGCITKTTVLCKIHVSALMKCFPLTSILPAEFPLFTFYHSGHKCFFYSLGAYRLVQWMITHWTGPVSWFVPFWAGA